MVKSRPIHLNELKNICEVEFSIYFTPQGQVIIIIIIKENNLVRGSVTTYNKELGTTIADKI